MNLGWSLGWSRRTENEGGVFAECTGFRILSLTGLDMSLLGPVLLETNEDSIFIGPRLLAVGVAS